MRVLVLLLLGSTAHAVPWSITDLDPNDGYDLSGSFSVGDKRGLWSVDMTIDGIHYNHGYYSIENDGVSYLRFNTYSNGDGYRTGEYINGNSALVAVCCDVETLFASPGTEHQVYWYTSLTRFEDGSGYRTAYTPVSKSWKMTAGIPEPGTIGMLGVGLIALSFLRRAA